LRANRRARARAGISDVMASILSIVITLIAGFSVFSYVNGQAAVSMRQLGSAYGSTVNYLQERFVVVNVNFSSSKVTIWLYNNGATTLYIVQVLVYNSTRSLYVLYNATKVVNMNNPGSCSVSPSGLENPLLYNPSQPSSQGIPVGQMQPLTLTLPSCLSSPNNAFNAGRAYTITVLALYGNLITYSQTR
jgi:hypothetical protein